MAEPRITITINGTTYSLCADNAEAIGNMPVHDRQHLVTLLEAVRSKTNPATAATPGLQDKSRIAAAPQPAKADSAARSAASQPTAAHIGSGDVDALMARLAAEDMQRRKPGLTRAGLYKVTGGFLLFIFLLVVIL